MASENVVRVQLDHMFNEDFAERLTHRREFQPYPTENLQNVLLPTTKLSCDQAIGVAWGFMRESRHSRPTGGLIMDELGFGKTLQMLSIAGYRMADALTRLRRGDNLSDLEKAYYTRIALGKTLLVCPSNLVTEWREQIQQHFQRHVFQPYVISPKTPLTQTAYDNHNFFMVTYGRFINVKEEIGKFHFYRSILDEVHEIRNPLTSRFKALDEFLKADVRWAITGTPVWNGIADLFGIFRYIQAFPYDDLSTFRQEVINPLTSKNAVRIYRSLESLCSFMERFSIRRPKCAENIPVKSQYIIRVQLSESERLFYDAFFYYCQDRVRRFFRTMKYIRHSKWGKRCAYRTLSMNISTILLRLRQICDHPFLIFGWKTKLALTLGLEETPRVHLLDEVTSRLRNALNEGGTIREECSICMFRVADRHLAPCGHMICGQCADSLFAFTENQVCPFCRAKVVSLVDSEKLEEKLQESQSGPITMEIDSGEGSEIPLSTKIELLMQHIDRQDPNDKILIFSQWIGMLKFVREALDKRGITSLTIMGSVTPDKRFDIRKKFRETSAQESRVMLCSLSCSSQGINLQRANVVYILDLWWNAARLDQAADRVHRNGQTKPVQVYYFICKDTIEESIWKMVDDKREVSSTITTGTSERVMGRDWEAKIRLAFNIRG